MTVAALGWWHATNRSNSPPHGKFHGGFHVKSYEPKVFKVLEAVSSNMQPPELMCASLLYVPAFKSTNITNEEPTLL